MGINKCYTESFDMRLICSNVMRELKSLQVGVTILRKCLFCLIVSKKKMNQFFEFYMYFARLNIDP